MKHEVRTVRDAQISAANQFSEALGLRFVRWGLAYL